MSDVAERPCGQLSPSEQVISSPTDGGQTVHSAGVPLERTDHNSHHSESGQIARDKYISDLFAEPRHHNTANAPLRTATCAAFYFVLLAIIRATIQPAF